MRIIAGRHRGRPILGPDSIATRPITDRAKQSLFDILAPRIEGARILDLFAGTGSMGLESLSRGAAGVVFFERDRSALSRLRKNLATLGESSRATIVERDIFEWFSPSRLAGEPARRGNAAGEHDPRQPGQSANGFSPADIIFLDPPYRYVRENAGQLQSLAASLAAGWLDPAGIVVFRHERGDQLALPSLTPVDQRTYGAMAIDLLQPIPAPADEITT